MDVVKLTEWTECGGCAAKWGGAPLAGLLRSLAGASDPALLVGLAPFDDAAVYRVSDDLALVSTTDFFPPLVDDPSDFGAIAAANACSDVFAMGGRVVVALNIAAFPEDMPTDAIAEIFDAAARTVALAGGTVSGGHTIRAAEPIFGLAVQGVVHPDRVWIKGAARAGDRLVLSKPLGTGIALAGHDDAARRAAVSGMRTLNRQAAEMLSALATAGGDSPVHAVTDVTGFGLAGHGWEIAERSGVEVVFGVEDLPVYPGVAELAKKGVRTGGEARNRGYLGERLVLEADEALASVVLDPQTSGGLLAAVEAPAARSLVAEGWSEVGEVRAGDASVHVARSR